MAGKEGENVRLMEENERLSEQVGLLNLDLCPRGFFAKHVFLREKYPSQTKKVYLMLISLFYCILSSSVFC